ncbi:multicopper oxidase domain-containing protein [Cellulomonas soli]
MTLTVVVLDTGTSQLAEGGASGDGVPATATATDHAGMHGDMTGADAATATDDATSAAADIDMSADPADGFRSHDATLAPAESDGDGPTTHHVTLTVQEVEREVAPGITQRLWTFGGQAPGPVLHGAVGDTFVITLVNDGSIGHSVDFHAGALAPDDVMRTIAPGERLTYTFTATRSGIWMYHCSTMPMSAHIANGMAGAVVIDPPGLPAVDREYLLVQSEYYLGPQGGEVDLTRLATQVPDLVTFNGYAWQYRHEPLVARTGSGCASGSSTPGPTGPVRSTSSAASSTPSTARATGCCATAGRPAPADRRCSRCSLPRAASSS